jgi:queuine tRNA-ribosyltransferase
MAIQRALGSDIVLPLDQPARWGEDPEPALRRSLAWLDESLREPLGEHQAMFAIVQGGFDPRLRRRAAEECAARNPAGFAIGGLSVGEPSEVMWEMAHVACAALPEERPRHLLGVGMPRDIVCAVAAGCDLFDCVLPTRLGRTGWAFTSEGILKLRHAAFRDDPRPLDERCACPACRRFSRAYLRHCLDEREIVGATLLSQHNVWAYMRLMEDIRAHIRAGTFGRFARSFGERAM